MGAFGLTEVFPTSKGSVLLVVEGFSRETFLLEGLSMASTENFATLHVQRSGENAAGS